MERFIAKKIDGKWYVWNPRKETVEKGPYASEELAKFVASDMNTKKDTW